MEMLKLKIIDLLFFFLQAREEHVRMRRCFKSMRHTSGEQVTVGDCVLLQSDGTDSNVPYVARVTRLWETLNGKFRME